MNKKKLISTLPPLTPTEIWDVRTGEEVIDWATPVGALLEYVQTETTRLFQEDQGQIFEHYTKTQQIGSANSYARQRGYTSNYKTLPKEILAKSRVNELVLHKFVSETYSHHQNPNPNKQEPTFYPKVNLGAVDKQMATLHLETPHLWLSWKVWDKELLFKFDVPAYVLKRSVTKWSLPTVQLSRKTNNIIFLFSTQENPTPLPQNNNIGGIDLGRVQPFTLAILKDKQVVKKVTSNPRLAELSQKRDRLIKQKNQTTQKLNHYRKLNHNPAKQVLLEQEIRRLRRKINRLGTSLAQQSAADLTKRLLTHNVTTLHLEDLKFVTGKKYGGRWNHSAQQAAITHATTRAGIIVRKVNPAGTSQYCHSCQTKITHNTKQRSVFCSSCKTKLDRDFNAALNIAKNQSYPHSYSNVGDNCSSTEQVIQHTNNVARNHKNDSLSQEIQLL